MRNPFHRGLARASLSLLLVSVAPAALAQYPRGATVEHLAGPDDPAEQLAQALRVLATEPNNLQALLTAGHEALALGDVNGAIGLYGRASAVAPRDGRVKAGLGAAMVQLQRPDEALRLFADARRLGIAPAQFAADEGLAYDLSGEQARAQQDYQVALAANPSDAIARRRLALSQGISGDRAGALKTLDPLIRQSDHAAWRDQTFVLAMTGDAPGANAITRVMLPQQSEMLQPFLARLATLSPAEKARAVTFGEIPQASRLGSPPVLASATPAYQSPQPYRAPGAAPTRTIGRPMVATQTAPVAAPPQRPTAIAQASDLAPRPPVQPPASEPTPVRVATAETPRPFPGPAVGTPAAADTRPQPDAAMASPIPVHLAEAPQAPNGATVGTPVLHQEARAQTPPVRLASVEPLPAAAMRNAPVIHDEEARPESPRPRIATRNTPVVHETVRSEEARRTETVREERRAAADEGDEQQTRRTARAHGSRHGSLTELAANDTRHGRRDTADNQDTSSARDGGTTATNDEASSSSRHGRSAGRHATRDEEADASSSRHHSKATDESDAAEPAATHHGKAREETASTKRHHGREELADSDTSSRHHSKSAADETDDAPKSAKGRHAKTAADGDDEAAPKTRHGKAAAKEEAAAPASRIYVQVAGGANRDDLDRAWDRLRKKAPQLTKGKKPLTTPLNHTNRLIVGPFASDDEAQAYVNKMAGKGISSFIFKSSKHQKIEKVDSAS